jgi:hypothetical protein
MEQVLAVFSDIRGRDNARRAEATEHLKAFHRQPGFSSVLLQIFLEQSLDVDTRQMAGVNLALLCKVHWSKVDMKFEEPELTPQEKEELKLHIPQALSEPSNKLRTTVASIISIMAHGDLPEKWPDLLENLTGCLLSEDMNLVHGAMKTLDLFASGNQLSDFHVPPLVDIVFPQLQRIFGEEGYPERIRMRAIRILHSIMAWLGTVKAEYPESIVGAVRPSLPGWYALFQSELSKPDEYGTGHGSKIGVLLVLFQLLVHFPEFIKADLPALVEPLWHSLTNSVEIWERTSIYGTEEDNSGYDSDAGDSITFKNYLCLLVEVFTEINSRKRLQGVLHIGMVDLAYVVLRLVQLTEQQVVLFEEDPNMYIVEEDEQDPMSFSLRMQAGRLLGAMATSMDGHGIEPISAAVQKHLQELSALQEQAHGGANAGVAQLTYNRRREGLLYGVGHALRQWREACGDLTLSGAFPTGSPISEVPFDVGGISKLTLVDCESDDMILRGRALWCASIASKMLPEACEIIESGERPEQSDPQVTFLVRNATEAMQRAGAPLPFLLSAAACVTELSELLDVQTLKETISVALPNLAVLAPELEEASLLSLLETLDAWVALDAESTTLHAPVLIDNVLEAWSRNSNNPYVPPLMTPIFQGLAKIPEVLPIAQERIGAVINEIFADPSSRDNGLVESCADLMSHLMMDAPWPLPPLFLDSLLPQLFSIMLHTVDNGMLQVGCTTLIALVRCAKLHLAEYPVVIGDVSATGLEFVVMTIDRVLNGPELNDFAAIFVGPLISKLIDTCASLLGDRVESILQSVVLRLERAETPSLIQDLITIFALLMRQNLDLVLQFLCSFHIPSTGEAALPFVLSLWTKTFEDRRGNYQMKVSILALASIFGHPQLTDVQVPADAAIEEALLGSQEAIGSRTRSKKKLEASLPRLESLNVRIFRLMLREHMWLLEERDAPAEMSSDEDMFSGGLEEAGDDSPFALASGYEDLQGDLRGTISLDRLLQHQNHVDDEETDPDILNDPAYDLDLEEYIYNWMKQLATENVEAFDFCVSQLSSIERDHLIHRLIESRQ